MLDDLPPAFDGDRRALRGFLASLPPGTWFTYLLLRPDGVPFYVGKGTGKRPLDHELEALRDTPLPVSNPFKCNAIRKIVAGGAAVGYRIDRVFAADQELACLQREEALIRRHRRRCDGGTLTNLAAGLGSLSARDPFSTARHAATLAGLPQDRPERAALNLFLSTLGAVSSVPIKPLSEYRSRLVAAYPSPKALQTPSPRNGLTLAAAAVASGQSFRPGAVIPRAFTLLPEAETWPLQAPPPARVAAVIENGAASDILKLGLAMLVPAPRPEAEGFALDAAQSARLVALMGRDWLEARDLI